MALKVIPNVGGPSKFDLMLALFDPFPQDSMDRSYFERELTFWVRAPRRKKVELRALIIGLDNQGFKVGDDPFIWAIRAEMRDEDLALALGLESECELPESVGETPRFTATYNSRTKKGELQIEIPEDQEGEEES